MARRYQLDKVIGCLSGEYDWPRELIEKNVISWLSNGYSVLDICRYQIPKLKEM